MAKSVTKHPLVALYGMRKLQNTYLLVELDKGWLELLLRVTSGEVIWELVVRVGLTSLGLGSSVVSDGSIRNVLHRSRLVLDVLDFA